MFKKTKGIVVGLILGIMLSGTVALAAGNTTTLYDVLTNGIRIVIDGRELHPTDANGNTVEPMIYNGTTYLPVRAVANAIGKAVYWDGPNYTVYLGDMDGELEYPTVMLKDMASLAETPTQTNNLTNNYGNRYSSAICGDVRGPTSGRTAQSYRYLLNMKYSRFKGTLYVIENCNAYGVYLTIEADGRTLYTSPEMSTSSAPIDIDVDVTGYNDVIITWNNLPKYDLSTVGLADAGFYQ